MNTLEDFDLLINEFESEVENLKSIKEAYSKLAKLVDSYEAAITNIQSASSSISSADSKLSESLLQQHKLLEEGIKKFTDLLIQKNNELVDSNKKFYNDFANTVQTRLEDNKMQIKQLIDCDSLSTRQQIQDLKSDYQAQSNLLIEKVENVCSTLTQQLQVQKKITLSLGIVSIALVIILIVLSIVCSQIFH
jgi:hypothetical protein